MAGSFSGGFARGAAVSQNRVALQQQQQANQANQLQKAQENIQKLIDASVTSFQEVLAGSAQGAAGKNDPVVQEALTAIASQALKISEEARAKDIQVTAPDMLQGQFNAMFATQPTTEQANTAAADTTRATELAKNFPTKVVNATDPLNLKFNLGLVGDQTAEVDLIPDVSVEGGVRPDIKRLVGKGVEVNVGGEIPLGKEIVPVKDLDVFVDDQGNHPEFGITHEELAPQGFKLRTTTRQTKDASLRGTKQILTSLRSLTETLFSDERGLLGSASNFAALTYDQYVQRNPNAIALFSSRAGFRVPLARALGEVGNLNLQEQQNVLNLLPGRFDTKQSAMFKLDLFEQVIAAVDGSNTPEQAESILRSIATFGGTFSPNTTEPKQLEQAQNLVNSIIGAPENVFMTMTRDEISQVEVDGLSPEQQKQFSSALTAKGF